MNDVEKRRAVAMVLAVVPIRVNLDGQPAAG